MVGSTVDRIARLAQKRSLITWLASVVVTWAVLWFSFGQIGYAIIRGNKLTELFDSYSEANGIRAGEGYADHGLTYNKGLPDVSYGNAFETVGGKHDKNLCPNLPCVYLHYPPGPDLVIGAMTQMCGKGEIACLRTAPLVVGILSLVFFAWAVARTMGIVRCAFVMGTFYFSPMITNAMHYLHYHSYVTSFLLVHTGLLLFAFVKPAKNQSLVLAGIFGVGFVQGCCSFDYSFHVALLAVPIWLLAASPKEASRTFVYCTLAAVVGYALANVLHFYQVKLYLGSWSAMYQDFAARASLRAGGEVEAGVAIQGPVRVLLTYWTLLLPQAHFLGFNFTAVCGAAFAALLAKWEVKCENATIAWRPLPAFKWAFLAGFIIPTLWLLMMRQHAAVHGHFLPRNFVVTCVIGAVVLAASLRRIEHETPGAAPTDTV